MKFISGTGVCSLKEGEKLIGAVGAFGKERMKELKTMNKEFEFFKPKDFIDCQDNGLSYVRANEKLNEFLESCPVVHSSKVQDWQWTETQSRLDTHKARLFGIEEIKKDCKHEPVEYQKHFGDSDIYYQCRKCYVELIATWSEKK